MNTMGKLMDAWFSLLKDNLTVPVYRIDAPETETGNYVIIRPEGGRENNTKHSFNDEVVIITDIVTKFNNNVNTRVAEDIDVDIFELILPSPYANTLSVGSGLQVLNVRRENFDYVDEYDGVNAYFRKVSRYSHRLHQQ